MTEIQKTLFQDIFSISEVPAKQNYLGVPFELARSKAKTFNFLKSKLPSKLQTWKAKRRDLLIKSTRSLDSSDLYNVSFFTPSKCDNGFE